MPFSAPCAAVLLIAVISSGATAQSLPHHQIISEDVSEKRRSVSVRVDQRLDEADALRIATEIHRRQKIASGRSYVNFFLPGVPASQGAWASVMFNPEPKFLAHGLKREDEQALIAEHRSDPRPLLGSWLTSPPAATGRLTIYSDGGRIYAEWRLKNGQRTVEELKDASGTHGRRFDLVGGGSYALTRSGDLEIWSGPTLVAVGERIRAEAGTAIAARSAPSRLPDALSARVPDTLTAPALIEPAQREAKAANLTTTLGKPSASTATSVVPTITTVPTAMNLGAVPGSLPGHVPGIATGAAVSSALIGAPSAIPGEAAATTTGKSTKNRSPSRDAKTAAAPSRKSRTVTSGDHISATLSGSI